MSPVKRTTDLSNYANVLPYASELFGVYQPLLGWKSKRLQERFDEGFASEKSTLLRELEAQFSDIVQVKLGSEDERSKWVTD